MFFLGSVLVSNTTIAPRLGKGSKVPPTICPITFFALFHLFHCFEGGTFAIRRMVQVFLIVGYASIFLGGSWSYNMVLKIFDMLKSWCSDIIGRSWRRKLACCSNKVSFQWRVVLIKTGHTSNTLRQLITYFHFVPFIHRSMLSQ